MEPTAQCGCLNMRKCLGKREWNLREHKPGDLGETNYMDLSDRTLYSTRQNLTP